MKRCPRCKRTKPLNEFYRDSSKPDGRDARCKECGRARARAYREANLDRELERQRIWREAHREYLRAAAHAYRRANPEKRCESIRAYKQVNPEKYRAYQARRRAHESKGVVADAVVIELVAQPCSYCDSTENIEVDHIIPLSRGGKHETENLAPACRRCNRSKGAKLLSEWDGPGGGPPTPHAQVGTA